MDSDGWYAAAWTAARATDLYEQRNFVLRAARDATAPELAAGIEFAEHDDDALTGAVLTLARNFARGWVGSDEDRFAFELLGDHVIAPTGPAEGALILIRLAIQLPIDDTKFEGLEAAARSVAFSESIDALEGALALAVEKGATNEERIARRAIEIASGR